MALCLKQRTIMNLHAMQAHDRHDNLTSVSIICGRPFGHSGKCDAGEPCNRVDACVRGLRHVGVCMVPRGR